MPFGPFNLLVLCLVVIKIHGTVKLRETSASEICEFLWYNLKSLDCMIWMHNKIIIFIRTDKMYLILKSGNQICIFVLIASF